MNYLTDNVKASASIVRGYLVVSLQGLLYDSSLECIRNDILEKIDSHGARGMILDFSALPTLDTFAFNSFSQITKMASLMGVTTLWAGLTPGVVSSLIDLNIDTVGIRAARTTEDGLQLLDRMLLPPQPSGNEYDFADQTEPEIGEPQEND